MKLRQDCTILSLGDLVVDLNVMVESFPILPEGHQLVQNIQFEPGGAGNFLMAGRRLGSQMTALGVVGQDLYGSELTSVFNSEGINTEGIIHQENGSTTLVFVLADGQGKHVFLGHVGEGPEVLCEDSWRSVIHRADAVHTYGYTLQETRLVNAFLEGMAYAQECQKPVFFDPGPYVSNVSWELRQKALDCCTAVLLTVEEIPLVVPGGSRMEDAAMLLSEQITLVVVKRGPNGCVAFTNEGELAHPGFPVTQVDSTGAGDSFAAALIISLVQGYPLADALAIANAMGAAKAKKIGSGRQVPTLDEVRDILGQDLLFE
jgi:sugar/nucleoside kinase (ribokinase family)